MNAQESSNLQIKIIEIVQMSQDRESLQGENQLPTNFMQTVIELETQLECGESSPVVFQQLNDLYVMAMNYYIQHDLRKLQHFHRKLTSLLTHPSTLQSIHNTQPTPQYDENSFSKNLRSQMRKFDSESMILVRSMLQGSEMKANNSKKAMIENIENQQALLNERLMRRGKSKSTTTGPLRS